ncbi:MAG: MAE_28990/MAE_18760 family HEPN-like nuclease [Candidatus Aminicenantes bacterium]|nr:MAE_28990/MAE_18760 family HEPN-like nuclease [Candidatus Aminicenantes bacterium]
MARYTIAYSSLVMRLEEVEVLRRSAAQKEKADPFGSRHEINALCRGSLVLLCAHLEAFVKELGEVVLEGLHSKLIPRTNLSPRIYYYISKDILDELRDTNDPDKIASKIFGFLQSDKLYWSRNGPFPQPITAERFNKGFSNPAYRKICSYFGRFGYAQYRHDLGRYLGAKYMPIITMVDHLVDTRNKISHGDPTTKKTPSEVGDMMALIRAYCLATDDVFASWCGTSICKIR